MTDRDTLRAAILALAHEWDNEADDYSANKESDPTNYDRGADDQLDTCRKRLRTLLAEHPAPGLSSECVTPTCPACYPSGGEVTADELADLLWESVDDKGIRGRLFRDDCNYLANTILEQFVVWRRS